MLELIMETFKKNRSIFIGIIVLLIMVGFLMGLFKKVPVRVIEINPKEIYREGVLSEIATLLSGKQENLDQLIQSMDESRKPQSEKKDETVKEPSFQNPFQRQPVEEEKEPQMQEKETETPSSQSESENKDLPGGIDQSEILRIEKTPVQ